MKILHLTKKYPNALGGDAVVVSNLEKQQRKVGDEVVIFTSNCDDIIDSPTIYKFGLKDTPAALDTITIRRLISLVFLFFKAYRIFKKERPDVIHTHSIDMAFFASFAARHYKIPMVHTFHIVTFNDPQHQGIRSKIELVFLRGAKPKEIFILNPGDITDFNDAGFKNVRFVPNGVNLEDWQVSEPTQKNKRFTFIAVGRLEEQKGFGYLIEAAMALSKAGADFQIQIVGEGALQQHMQAHIIKEKLENVVYLLGRKSPSELKLLYAQANVFVLSSLWEGMPLTLLEAWAAGLPTIATKVNSVPYIAASCAQLIAPRDSSELASAMQKLMDSPELRAGLAQKSLENVRSNYQWEIISRHLYDGVV